MTTIFTRTITFILMVLLGGKRTHFLSHFILNFIILIISIVFILFGMPIYLIAFTFVL